MEQNHNENTEIRNEKSSAKATTSKQSPLTIALIAIAGLVIVGTLVSAGVMVFSHKNSQRSAIRDTLDEESAGRNFGMGRGGMMRDGFGTERVGRNIISGKITAINGDTLTVSANNKNYTINIQDTTEIYNGTSIASKSDFKTDQSVTVQGKPNSSGQINANIIEIE